MGYKPAGVDEVTSLFAPRVMTALRKLFPATNALSNDARKSGSIIGWCGDSHTVGSGPSNAYNSFRFKSSDVAGGLIISLGGSINGGVAGERSDQLLLRIPGIISAGAQTLFVLVGTGDAGQGITVTQYASNIQAIKALADQANIGFVIATIPPRGASASADTVLKTNSYNMWLRTWAASNKIPLADLWSATVDQATGFLRAAHDSGDGIHLNDAGHAVMSQVIAATMKTVIQEPAWPITSNGLGLTNDPLALDNNQFQSSRWDVLANYYPELNINVIDSSQFALPAGRWVRFLHNNASTTDTRYTKWRKAIDTTKFASGDKLLFLLRIRGSEVGAINKLEIYDQNGSVGLFLDLVSVINPGPVAFAYTVPATKPTSLSLVLTQGAPPNRLSWVDVGTADVLNLTTLGVNFNGL